MMNQKKFQAQAILLGSIATLVMTCHAQEEFQNYKLDDNSQWTDNLFSEEDQCHGPFSSWLNHTTADLVGGSMFDPTE